MDWTGICKEETGYACTQNFQWKNYKKKLPLWRPRTDACFGIIFFWKICYTDRMCMEKDQKCVLLGILLQDLKLRVPKLSLYEWLYINYQLWCTDYYLFIKYYSLLHVSSLKCSSSEGYSCTHAAYGTVTLYESSCCMCTTVSSWRWAFEARNM